MKHPASLCVDTRYPRSAYAWYVLAVLTLVYVFSFLDRQILNLLVTPVRRDLQISDTQMSVLIGFAFALFYVGFGVPLGRVADSRSRRTVIAMGFACWSLFTAGCGLTKDYAQLLIMRMGVGVGEASLSPAAYSLITDYFPPNRRGFAQGIYSTGIYIGAGVSYAVGGFITALSSQRSEYTLPLVGTVRSWQVVFLVIGLFGLLLVPVIATVKEPARRGAGRDVHSVPLRDVLAHFAKNRNTYLCHNVGLAMLTFSGYGSGAWVPTFFIRHHHWSVGQTGFVYGMLVAVFGTLGVFCCGWLADRQTARGCKDAHLRIAFFSAVLWFPTGIAFLVVSNPILAAALLAPTIALAASYNAVGPTSLMQVTPPRMRGQAGAIYLFVVNLIGLGIGPTAVALCTNYVFQDDSLVGYSILIVSCVAHVLAGLLLWRGREHHVRSQEAAVEWMEVQTV